MKFLVTESTQQANWMYFGKMASEHLLSTRRRKARTGTDPFFRSCPDLPLCYPALVAIDPFATQQTVIAAAIGALRLVSHERSFDPAPSLVKLQEMEASNPSKLHD
jgi:hypothetical protein